MITVGVVSFSGGQGKTTTALFLALLLARSRLRVLLVDCDPQASTTFYIGCQVESNQSTLLEVIKGRKPHDAIVPLVEVGVDLIPSDNGLNDAQNYIASSGLGVGILRQRLLAVQEDYDVCVLDSPPQGMHLSLSAIAASNCLVIPAEAGSKGLNSVLRTLETVEELRSFGLFSGEVLGILPFRDKWFGLRQANCSRDAIAAIKQVAGDIPVLQAVLESERFRKSIDAGELPIDDVLEPIQKLAEGIKARCVG